LKADKVGEKRGDSLQTKEWGVEAILYKDLARMMKQVIGDEEVAMVGDEWRLYQVEDVPQDWIMDSDSEEYKRIDDYWNNVFNIKSNITNQPKFKVLPLLVKTCLSLSHGNADVERSLSDNKNTVTPERSSLALETIIGLRRTKDYVKCKGGRVDKLDITKQMHVSVQQASTHYHGRKREEEREKAESERLKKVQAEERKWQKEEKAQMLETKESLAKEEKKLQVQEQQCKETLKVAEKLMKEADERIAKAMAKKDFGELEIAQALLTGSRKKMETARSKSEECAKQRNKIEKKKRKLIDKLTEDDSGAAKKKK
jgi:pescadillo protein